MALAQTAQEMQSAHDSVVMLWVVVLFLLGMFFVIAFSNGSGPDDGVPGDSNPGCAAIFGFLFAIVFFSGLAKLIW